MDSAIVDGGNIAGTMKKIKAALASIKQMENERSETNAGIAEVRASMEALGIPKKAFDMARRYLTWKPEDREGFDLAYALVREAGGLPIAEDLFSAAERVEKEKADATKAQAKATDADAIKQREKAEADKVFSGVKSLN